MDRLRQDAARELADTVKVHQAEKATLQAQIKSLMVSKKESESALCTAKVAADEAQGDATALAQELDELQNRYARLQQELHSSRGDIMAKVCCSHCVIVSTLAVCGCAPGVGRTMWELRGAGCVEQETALSNAHADVSAAEKRAITAETRCKGLQEELKIATGAAGDVQRAFRAAKDELETVKRAMESGEVAGIELSQHLQKEVDDLTNLVSQKDEALQLAEQYVRVFSFHPFAGRVALCLHSMVGEHCCGSRWAYRSDCFVHVPLLALVLADARRPCSNRSGCCPRMRTATMTAHKNSASTHPSLLQS